MRILRAGDAAYHQLESSATGEKYSLSHEIGAALGASGLFFSKEILPPGSRASAPHRHLEASEVVFVLKGAIVALEGSEKVLLREGDSLCFEAGARDLHFIRNEGRENAEVLLIRPLTDRPDVNFW